MEFKLKGADTYYNNGSTWIILTDKKQWVIELTKDGTLWYNFYFLQSILAVLMWFEDTVKNQKYITNWAENLVKNGVKHTDACQIGISTSVEDAIQNGVKETFLVEGTRTGIVENTIQNGVKETKHNPIEDSLAMEEVIENGIKHTEYGDWLDGDERLDDIIENGVKETWGYEKQPQKRIDEVIMNGQKDWLHHSLNPEHYIILIFFKFKNIPQLRNLKS